MSGPWISIVLLAAAVASCERPGGPSGYGEMRGGNEVVTVVAGFGGKSSIVIEPARSYIDETYYDLSEYDSIRINFTATRLFARPILDHIQVRVGVAYAFLDTLSVESRQYSILILGREIVKPATARFRFSVAAMGSDIEFSHLTISGWR